MKFKLSLRFSLIMLLLVSPLTHAKTLADKAKADQASTFFMGQILAGDIEAAYSLMSAYLGIDMSTFVERSKKVENDLKKLEQNIGKPLSYALLKKQSVDDHFYKVSYLLKYETAALVWEINFYQPDSGWRLVDISFNGDINALFE